jgi:hypothetical protein
MACELFVVEEEVVCGGVGEERSEVAADEIGGDAFRRAAGLGEQFAQRRTAGNLADSGAGDRARDRDERVRAENSVRLAEGLRRRPVRFSKSAAARGACNDPART